MANYGPLRDVARKWLFNPDHPNKCATQGEVDDLATLLNDVRDKALEEAACICETDTFPRDRGEYPARLIRELKSGKSRSRLQ
jgi:hypothetical protein